MTFTENEKEEIKNVHKHSTHKNLMKKLTGNQNFQKTGTEKYDNRGVYAENTVFEETELSDDDSLESDQITMVLTEKAQKQKD